MLIVRMILHSNRSLIKSFVRQFVQFLPHRNVIKSNYEFPSFGGLYLR